VSSSIHTPNIQVRLQWLPRKVPFVGSRRARQLDFEAIRSAGPAELHPHEPHSIKKQKDTAKREAIITMKERYYNGPHTSFAYQTALRAPPDRKAHHTFKIVPASGRADAGHTAPNAHNRETEPEAKFSRQTYSTLSRYITGHAFTGEYTQRFYPLHTQEQIECPCGTPLQTIEHVLTECLLYTAARQRHFTANGRPRTLPQRKREARPRSAPLPGGDRRLRQAAGEVGTGLRQRERGYHGERYTTTPLLTARCS